MAEKQLYAAIDLGTTNSVIAYGNIVNDHLKPLILDLDRKNDTGSRSRSSLLPSVVFYYKNKEGGMSVDVGDYAKSRYGTRAGYVCRSVKSLMGTSQDVPYLADEIEDKTPADVSAQILSYMVGSAKTRLFQRPTDVIITVPASFDSDQCQATIDAAEKAGINVHNEHDILLYEPKAVIYDFMRMQEAGEIPSDLLTLEEEKNVLVFDLGGGTLDVTIHRIGRTPEGLLNIRDLAISRYTRLGGDNFDELLAADMLKRFEEMYGITVSVKRKEEVLCRLRQLAEQLKTELSLQYENAHMMDVELPDDYEFEKMDMDLYDNYSFECTYTKKEVEDIVSPLMGDRYKKEDARNIQRLSEKDVDNIIYPILDVLDKAGADIKIDAVLLNGGMTKFYLIRNRLKEFFGFEPLTTADPDLAVARGAVYYHYCLHKYHITKNSYTDGGERAAEKKPLFNTGTILNDSINLGLRGEYVSLLIPAGTELPYRSEEIRDRYKLERGTSVIGIELFLGRGKTKNLPNRRIATRVVKLPKEYPANTPISFRIYIDAMRMMTMEAWITDKPKTKTIMEMDIASLKKAEKTLRGIAAVGRQRLNARSELNELRNLHERNQKKPDHDLNPAIANRIRDLGRAENPEDFYEPCEEILGKCQQADVMRGYVYGVAAGFRDGWSDARKRRFLREAKRHFDPSLAGMVAQHNYVKRRAMELIASFDPEFLAFYEAYLPRMTAKEDSLRAAMLQFAIRFAEDEESLQAFLKKYLRQADLNNYVAAELLRRYGDGSVQPNPLRGEDGMNRPIRRMLDAYFEGKEDRLWAAAVTHRLEDAELSPEEQQALQSLMACANGNVTEEDPVYGV